MSIFLSSFFSSTSGNCVLISMTSGSGWSYMRFSSSMFVECVDGDDSRWWGCAPTRAMQGGWVVSTRQLPLSNYTYFWKPCRVRWDRLSWSEEEKATGMVR